MQSRRHEGERDRSRTPLCVLCALCVKTSSPVSFFVFFVVFVIFVVSSWHSATPDLVVSCEVISAHVVGAAEAAPYLRQVQGTA